MLQTLELWGVSIQKCMQDSRSVFIIRISLIKKWRDFPSKYFLRADDHSVKIKRKVDQFKIWLITAEFLWCADFNSISLEGD